MKKTIISALVAAFVCGGAYASDGGLYSDTETFSTRTTYNTNTYTVRERPAQVQSSCGCQSCGCAAPVRVKTHTEVIDHYQVYKPVTVYQPAGTYTQRRIVSAPRCNSCNM